MCWLNGMVNEEKTLPDTRYLQQKTDQMMRWYSLTDNTTL